MSYDLRPAKAKVTPKPKKDHAITVFAKSVIATGGIICAMWFGVYFSEIFHYFHHRPADQVTEEQAKERIVSFKALSPIRLMIVPEEDTQSAIETMQLSPDAKKSLLAELVDPSSDAHQQHGVSDPPIKAGSVDSSLSRAASSQDGQDEKVEASKIPVPEPVPNRKNRRLGLAWISLWDTDAEDGDTVQIECQGYSRTVILKKTPITFAVPVPEDGVVKIIGIRDGEGGGITVGLASGASKVVFPIMSEGQVLNLKVTMN